MTMEPDEPYTTLRAAWLDYVNAATTKDRSLGAAAWDGNPAKRIVGLAQKGCALSPCLYVASERDVAEARRFGARFIEGPVDVDVVAPLHVRPFRPNSEWGMRNAFPGRMVGGQAFYRDGQRGRSGGTRTLVLRRRAGGVASVGCMHCYTPDEGTAARGDEFLLKQVPDAVDVARVDAWHQVTTAWGTWPNVLDAGTAHARPSHRDNQELGVIGGVGRVRGIGKAAPGESVSKQGATTGLTTGVVTAINVVSRVDYHWTGCENAEFVVSGFTEVRAQQLGQEFSAPGDSGSPVFRRGEAGIEWLGMVVAGNGRTLYLPCEPVLETFDLELPKEEDA